jgi:hypothetical protein
VSSTYDALRQAERDREQAGTSVASAFDQLAEDVAALRVTVHALEDRVELELGGLHDELREALAKLDDAAASRSRLSEDRVLSRLGWIVQAEQRSERRLNAVAVLAGLGALIALVRC